ncbi:hypothetical protein YC2023_122288 [Brassica napus]
MGFGLADITAFARFHTRNSERMPRGGAFSHGIRFLFLEQALLLVGILWRRWFWFWKLLRETADEVGREEDVRPPGVKASKAAKRKKHGNEAAFDQIETILAAKNMLSKQKILDRLLGKNADTLTDQELALKNKLISELL